MKKAKIMLAAIAVLGIVGGTLAFKAQKSFGASYAYATVIGNKYYCITNFATTTKPAGETTTFGFLKTTAATEAYEVYPVQSPAVYCTSPATVYTAAAE